MAQHPTLGDRESAKGKISEPYLRRAPRDFALPGESDEQSYQRNVGAMIPQGEPQTEEDMAEAVMFLALSDHVTGQAISVDGGACM
jgi:NAD(P)-dependent dehydrogenase (short-subunit alcohol dehydrogenase family)